MAKAAHRSQLQIDNGSDDAFYRTKLKTAEFYFSSEMNRVTYLRDTIMESAELVAETDTEMFKVA